MLAVSWINSQIVFDGIVQGLAIAVIAVGVVLVYRATRIINFAVGNMGVVGAALLVVAGRAVPRAVLGGARRGARRRAWPSGPSSTRRSSAACGSHRGSSSWSPPSAWRRSPQAIAFKIPQPTTLSIHYPSALNGDLDRGRRAGPRLGPLDPDHRPRHAHRPDLVPRPDDLGKTVKACASNPQLARLSSISPKMVSTMVWALAAALSTLSVVLIAGQTGAAGD